MSNSHPRSANEVDKRIGSKLRARRLELGLSQEHLADAIGVTFQQIQKYEKGVNRVAASTLVRILPVLQMRVSDLFADIVDTTAPSLDDAETIALVKAFQSIRSKAKRRAVVNSVRALVEQ